MFFKMLKWTAVSYLTVTFLGFLPLFNWQYCNNHSFNRWMPGGIWQASTHALAWPVFIQDLRPGPFARLKRSMALIADAEALTRGWNVQQVSSPGKWPQVRGKLQEALAEARLIDANALDALYPGLGTHFDMEYRPGLERIIRNPEFRLDADMMVGMHLMSLWLSWGNANQEALNKDV